MLLRGYEGAYSSYAKPGLTGFKAIGAEVLAERRFVGCWITGYGDPHEEADPILLTTPLCLEICERRARPSLLCMPMEGQMLPGRCRGDSSFLPFFSTMAAGTVEGQDCF
jgi:hypothetical protein